MIEPDSSVWHILEENRRKHHCGFWTYRGFVTDRRSITVVPASYATRTLATQSEFGLPDQRANVLNFDEIKKLMPFKFDVLLFDCEGCIDVVFHNKTSHHLQHILADTRLIIIEGDMSIKDPACHVGCVDYLRWLHILENLGFSLSFQQADRIFPNIVHFVLTR